MCGAIAIRHLASEYRAGDCSFAPAFIRATPIYPVSRKSPRMSLSFGPPRMFGPIEAIRDTQYA